MVYAHLGSCSYNLGRYEEALSFMTKAREQGSDIPEEFFTTIRRKMAEKEMEQSGAD